MRVGLEMAILQTLWVALLTAAAALTGNIAHFAVLCGAGLVFIAVTLGIIGAVAAARIATDDATARHRIPCCWLDARLQYRDRHRSHGGARGGPGRDRRRHGAGAHSIPHATTASLGPGWRRRSDACVRRRRVLAVAVTAATTHTACVGNIRAGAAAGTGSRQHQDGPKAPRKTWRSSDLGVNLAPGSVD